MSRISEADREAIWQTLKTTVERLESRHKALTLWLWMIDRAMHAMAHELTKLNLAIQLLEQAEKAVSVQNGQIDPDGTQA